MKETGWEKAEDLILELHAAGPGVPAAREAVAQGETETERLIERLHAEGPNKLAPRCFTCLGKTASCTPACDNDPACPFSTENTVLKLQALLDEAWASAHAGKRSRDNRLT
jgi:hypothetical protein